MYSDELTFLFNEILNSYYDTDFCNLDLQNIICKEMITISETKLEDTDLIEVCFYVFDIIFHLDFHAQCFCRDAFYKRFKEIYFYLRKDNLFESFNSDMMILTSNYPTYRTRLF